MDNGTKRGKGRPVQTAQVDAVVQDSLENVARYAKRLIFEADPIERERLSQIFEHKCDESQRLLQGVATTL